MGEPTLKVGAVDIGTNSMRLLIAEESREYGRWVEVTGLGQGVDASGRLDETAMQRTVDALQRFGELMDSSGVARRRAIATSASRDAANREEFFDRAESALGVRPTLISGAAEARLAFDGATARLDSAVEAVVSDIGGGSTEFVSAMAETSVDIGTVRLTEKALRDRPATGGQMKAAAEIVAELFGGVAFGDVPLVVGVAGTWTSLAAMAQDLDEYASERVHGYSLARVDLVEMSEELAVMTLAETANIPSLDPKRAPVMLSGAVIAVGVMEALGVDAVLISENDTLDGVATELLALA
ncbi:MAG: Ppx/GppA phosphatase family protein [Actinomycetota bacterium]|nr:Ppx/GppA phosphatase family protein [Actinomycetota bacterium]